MAYVTVVTVPCYWFRNPAGHVYISRLYPAHWPFLIVQCDKNGTPYHLTALHQLQVSNSLTATSCTWRKHRSRCPAVYCKAHGEVTAYQAAREPRAISSHMILLQPTSRTTSKYAVSRSKALQRYTSTKPAPAHTGHAMQ